MIMITLNVGKLLKLLIKVMIEWVRRQIRGGNIYQDGDEQST